MQKKLRKLAGLAEMVRDRDLSSLAAIAQDCAALKAQIATIDEALRARRDGLATMEGADAAMAGGADAKWVRFSEERAEALRTQLAEALARREAAKAEAQRALGRADVLDRLARR